ncbi:MAG: SRPBCC domain-containing protein [Terracidiphilus sp.]
MTNASPTLTPAEERENTTPTRTLVIEREMPHPPEKIWRALTEGQLIEEWLMKNDFKPVVGHRFNFRSTPVPGWNGVIDGEVLVVEPNSQLSYSWGTMGMESAVTWTLTPTAVGTHVRMEQSGFRSEESHEYKGATYGWRNFIGNLERVAGGLS